MSKLFFLFFIALFIHCSDAASPTINDPVGSVPSDGPDNSVAPCAFHPGVVDKSTISESALNKLGIPRSLSVALRSVSDFNYVSVVVENETDGTGTDNQIQISWNASTFGQKVKGKATASLETFALSASEVKPPQGFRGQTCGDICVEMDYEKMHWVWSDEIDVDDQKLSTGQSYVFRFSGNPVTPQVDIRKVVGEDGGSPVALIRIMPSRLLPEEYILSKVSIDYRVNGKDETYTWEQSLPMAEPDPNDGELPIVSISQAFTLTSFSASLLSPRAARGTTYHYSWDQPKEGSTGIYQLVYGTGVSASEDLICSS